MKTITRLSTLVILLLATHSALAYYSPGAGRWLNRDPIQEKGGNNVYVFCNNSPPSNFDVLGLNVCGVNWLRLTPKGWKYASGYGSLFFEFDIEAKLREDWGLNCKHFDPKCCRYVQWVNAYQAVGGTVLRTARGGMPISDGLAHLDYLPYRGDSIQEAINSRTWPEPTSTSYKTSDNPGIHNAPFVLTPGTSVDFQFLFIGMIVDTCNGNARVASSTIYADATGKLFRGLSVTPPPLRSSNFP